MPEHSILDALGARFDRAIGSDALKPVMRVQFLHEQAREVARAAPVMAAGALMVSLAFLYLSYGGPLFTAIGIWTAALYLGAGTALVRWRSAARETAGRNGTPAAMRPAIVNAVVLGAIWGALPIIVLPDGDIAMKVATALAIASVLCAVGFAMLIVPQAALAFSAPLLGGAVVAMMRLGQPIEAVMLTAFFAAYAGVMGIVCVRAARGAVHRLQAEAKIREQGDIIRLLLREFEDDPSDWLWEFDRMGILQRVSDRFALASGIEKDQLIGLHLVDLLRTVGQDNDEAVEQIAHDILAKVTFSGVELRVQVNGSERYWRLTGTPAYDAFGVFSGYIGTGSDVTADKISERRISFLAHNDSLTGLLNRTKFTEHLKQCVSRLERYGSAFAVLYLDLDEFKAVNDKRGHLVGDKLLVHVARRIRAALRETDIACRLGGDEFAVLLTGTCGEEETAALAQRLVNEISEPYTLDDDTVAIGVSIGIAIAPQHGSRADEILRNADLALYRSKAEGRCTFRFFETQMDSAMKARRMLEADLRRALEESEFTLHYQPLVSADDGRPAGLEALMRWNHPSRGLVMPADFIPVAEETGLIRQLGDWTIREACAAAARWPDGLIVAVNVSARHFQTSDIVQVVADALVESGLAPHRLELEITENLLIDQKDEVRDRLLAIKELGVIIALDDFGIGYASLSHLLRFPLDKIKIDGSFIAASATDIVARDTLRSIATLGQTLNMKVTAEGVETAEQAEFLREISFSQLQGYHFGKPLSERDLAAYLLNQFGRRVGALDGAGLSAPRLVS